MFGVIYRWCLWCCLKLSYYGGSFILCFKIPQLTYTPNELADLLEIEFLKHSSIRTSTGNNNIKIFEGALDGEQIGILSVIGGNDDITFNNSLQNGIKKTVTQLADSLKIELLKSNKISEIEINYDYSLGPFLTIHGLSDGSSIGDITFTGGYITDLNINNQFVVGNVTYTPKELADLLEIEILKLDSISSSTGNSNIKTFYGSDNGVQIGANIEVEEGWNENNGFLLTIDTTNSNDILFTKDQDGIFITNNDLNDALLTEYKKH